MIRKHYLYVDARQVHYRRAGNGPPLVILPAVPHSSAMVEPLIAELADRHTVIALDAPGYGESAALGAAPPAVSDYAEALAATLDALSLPRVDLYGVETSAAVAAELALRRPEIRRLVLDRPHLPDAAEEAEWLARACPVLEPDDEGSHLVRAWGRLRDSYTFRPWYRRAKETRLRRDLPSPLDLHFEITDFFRAGLQYWQGLHAAWRYGLASTLRSLAVATTVLDTAAGHDRTRSRLAGELPPNLTLTRLRDPDANDAPQQIAARILEALSGDPLPDAPPPPKVTPVPGAIRRDYADSRIGQLLVRLVGSGRANGGGRTLLLTSGSLGSGKGTDTMALTWAADRPVVGFDTPGSGDSPAVPGTPEMDEIAAAIVDGMDSLGLDEVDLYGSHTSAMTAIELGIARPKQVKHAILNGVTMFNDEQLAEKRSVYFQPLRISDDGAYLVWCWHYLRDMWLWYPWHDHRGDHLRPDWNIQDPVSQHARLGDFLKCGLTYISPYRAAVDYRSWDRLPLLKVPTLLCAASDDTLRGVLPEAASLVPHAIALETPGKDSPDSRTATDALFRHYLDDEPLGAGTPI